LWSVFKSHRSCESGIKHAAHRLVQHTLQVVEVTWINDSTLAIFFYMLVWAHSGLPQLNINYVVSLQKWVTSTFILSFLLIRPHLPK